MSKKDFILIADIIKRLNFTRAHKQFVAESFADRLASTNPLFDRARFLAACLD